MQACHIDWLIQSSFHNLLDDDEEEKEDKDEEKEEEKEDQKKGMAVSNSKIVTTVT